MFTELKKGRLSYMFLAALATLVIAVVAALFSSHPTDEISSRAEHENEQVYTGRYVHYNETVTRFIN
jgi:hypothetical protein